VYVCICAAATERQVHDAVCRGARTQQAVERACGAGNGCGSCHERIRWMIENHASEYARVPVGAGV
jgi:bacterioferritin-associated ferredoxin